jgi:hypothetical protein
MPLCLVSLLVNLQHCNTTGTEDYWASRESMQESRPQGQQPDEPLAATGHAELADAQAATKARCWRNKVRTTHKLSCWQRHVRSASHGSLACLAQ